MAHIGNMADITKITDGIDKIADFGNMSITNDRMDFTVSYSSQHNETFSSEEDLTTVKRKLVMETSNSTEPISTADQIRLRSGLQYKNHHDYESTDDGYLEHEVQMYREPELCEKLQYARSSYPIRDGLLRSPLHDERWVTGHEMDCHYHSAGCRKQNQSTTKRKSTELLYARDSYPSRIGLRRKPLHSRNTIKSGIRFPTVRVAEITKTYKLRWLVLSLFVLCLIILFVVWLKDDTAQYLYRFY